MAVAEHGMWIQRLFWHEMMERVGEDLESEEELGDRLEWGECEGAEAARAGVKVL